MSYYEKFILICQKSHYIKQYLENKDQFHADTLINYGTIDQSPVFPF